MDFFSNFLQQKVPKSGKELPVYYRKALCVSEILLIAAAYADADGCIPVFQHL